MMALITFLYGAILYFLYLLGELLYYSFARYDYGRAALNAFTIILHYSLLPLNPKPMKSLILSLLVHFLVRIGLLLGIFLGGLELLYLNNLHQHDYAYLFLCIICFPLILLIEGIYLYIKKKYYPAGINFILLIALVLLIMDITDFPIIHYK